MPYQEKPTQRTDYVTPMPLVEMLGERFGPFVLDAAATKRNTRCEEFISRKQDAFKTGWWLPTSAVGTSQGVFCNPPWGRGLGAWVDRACGQASLRDNVGVEGNIVMLLPVRTDNGWFQACVAWHCAEILFFGGRIRFVGQKSGVMVPVMAAIWGVPRGAFGGRPRISSYTLSKAERGY